MSSISVRTGVLTRVCAMIYASILKVFVRCVRRYTYRSVRCYVNRSSAYDPAVDIRSEADGSAVDILRCIRMRIQSTICI